MARKSANMLKSRVSAAEGSWAAVGIDTSMSSVAVAGCGYDALTDKLTEVAWQEVRWLNDNDYLSRLGDASRAHDLVLDVLHQLFVIKTENVYIAIEEPWYYGAVKQQQSGWLKQQAEVGGAVKGSLIRWGFTNLFEVNNQSWRKVLKDEEGVTIARGADGKWDIKAWAVGRYGLPELPDLVKDKLGSKIPRPESGYGANAKAVQPDDVYDAVALMRYMLDCIEKGTV